MGNVSNAHATDQVVLCAGRTIAIVPSLMVFAIRQRSVIPGLTPGALGG
jgi:ABC-type glycerol-3-phosphate transport system permease component